MATNEELPPELAEERDAVITEIYVSFAGVTREGGVSWSEAEVWGAGPKSEAAARDQDTDTEWTQLIDDEDWIDGEGCPNYPFLDAIGFRYYIPVTMVRSLRGEESEFVMCRLMTTNGVPSDYASEQWSALDSRQRACVARFLLCMADIETARYGRSWFSLDPYWARFLPYNAGG